MRAGSALRKHAQGARAAMRNTTDKPGGGGGQGRFSEGKLEE